MKYSEKIIFIDGDLVDFENLTSASLGIKQAINSSNISIGDVITFGNSPIEKITNYVFDNNDELYNCFIKLNLIESIQPKAIMCDVDGTLLSSNGLVLKDTIEAIKKVKKAGIIFGLSTGRDVNSVKNLLETWGISGLVDIVVGTGGSEIYDYLDRSYEENYPLDGNQIKEIVEYFEDMDLNFAIPYNGILFAPKDDRHIQLLAKADMVPYQVVDYNEFLKKPRAKLIIVCDEELMDQVVLRVQSFKSNRFKSSSLITASILYEYMDPRVSKTNGLIQAFKKYRLFWRCK